MDQLKKIINIEDRTNLKYSFIENDSYCLNKNSFKSVFHSLISHHLCLNIVFTCYITCYRNGYDEMTTLNCDGPETNVLTISVFYLG